MKKLFIFFDQLETDGSENIDSCSGGLWAVHRAADLPVTKNFIFAFVLLNHFMSNFLIKIVV